MRPRDLTVFDRLAFAAEHLTLMMERRGTLTDSDVLDAAECWTLPDDRDDYNWLVAALFDCVEQADGGEQ